MYIKNDRGGALVLVILVIAMLGILGSAFVLATTGEGLQAIGHEQQTQAHYNARSGARIGLEWLKSEKGQEWLENDSAKPERKFYGDSTNGLVEEKEGKESADMILTIAKSDLNSEDLEKKEIMVTIISEGNYMNKDEKIEITNIKAIEGGYDGPSISDEIEILKSDIALFSLSTRTNKSTIAIKNGNGTEINGSVGIRSKSQNTFEATGNLKEINGNFYIAVDENDVKNNKQIVKGNGRADILSFWDSKKGIVKNEEELKLLYPQMAMPRTPQVESISNRVKERIIKDKTYTEPVEIYHGTENIEIENATFKKDVIIDGNLSNVDITNCIFEGNVYIKGSDMNGKNGKGGNTFKKNLFVDTTNEIYSINDEYQGDVYMKSDNIYTKNNSSFISEVGKINTVVLDAAGNIGTSDTEFDGNVYMKLNSDHIEVGEATKFAKNLFINGGGDDKEVRFGDSINIGGILYAPNRDLVFFQNDENGKKDKIVTVGHSIIGNTAMFYGSLRVGYDKETASLDSTPSYDGELEDSEASGDEIKFKIIEKDAKWRDKK